MASNFRVQKPYVLARLPTPSAFTSEASRFTIGEVFSQQHGSRKRKRTELAVGIDHDSVNLYDVSSSRLITSYPTPPQSTFTCPPYSLRRKSSTTKEIVRYTYVATHDAQSSRRQVVLFKDVLEASGSTIPVMVSQTCHSERQIVHLSATAASSPSPILDGQSTEQPGELILAAVHEEGTVTFFHGETLQELSQIPSSALLQDFPAAVDADCRVEFVQQSSAADVVSGIFDEKAEAFGVLPQKIDRDGFNPDVLLLVTSVLQQSTGTRQQYLHVLVLAAQPGGREGKNASNAIQIFATPLPAPLIAHDGPSKYGLDVRSGSLMWLRGGALHSCTIRGSIPRLEYVLEVPEATSFIRLSKSSVLVSTPETFEIYNPGYRSLQASAPIDIQSLGIKGPSNSECELIAYFAGLEIVVGLCGVSLLAAQVEAPKTRKNKRRAQGLLIDSLGRGLSQKLEVQKRARTRNISSVLSGALPGTMSEGYWAEWRDEAAKADDLLHAHDLVSFESMLATKFQIELGETTAASATNLDEEGEHAQKAGDSDASPELPEWQWPSSSAEYPLVDRRWILYAITRVFAWNERHGEAGEPRLTCQLPESNVLNYLIDAGHLTASNLRSAFRSQVDDEVGRPDSVFEGELPPLLASIDPTMGLMVHYLEATKLGAVELLTTVRLVMSSLGLVQDPMKPLSRAITSGYADSGQQQDEHAAIGMELDRAEEELEVTEYYYLGDQSSLRARALAGAFSKLRNCPAAGTVQSIRRLYKHEETLSLINILRTELIRDGWATRYMDTGYAEESDGDEASDGSICIISELLCRCIDSIGPGGWLINDAVLANFGRQQETADFFEQLKLEVSAALEGIEEAVRLRGILGEAVRYGAGVQKAQAATNATKPNAKHKPTSIQAVPTDGGRMLPFGLKPKSGISSQKVVSGGEIVQRSRREIGYLASKRVGPYSLERITV